MPQLRGRQNKMLLRHSRVGMPMGITTKSILVLAICVLSMFYVLTYAGPSRYFTAPRQTVLPPISTSAYYHLLIPASSTSSNLCKTLFSASVLSYPTPRLINWNRTFTDPDLIFGGSHVAKINGVLDYLRSLPSASDESLVSIVDGYDVWFQLRPEVMIERYKSINQRANSRIKARLGRKIMANNDIRQTVVFSAQKKCWPAGKQEPACFAVPESELDMDAYGADTDRDLGDEKHPFSKMRQQYLNSGTVMGPVADVRVVYQKAAEKLAQGANIGSDQGIFAEIFGEQELQRTTFSKSWSAWWDSWVGRKALNPWEFHIGLDYKSELSQATVFSENDLAWIKHNDAASVAHLSDQIGIVNGPRVTSLQQDVARSRPPFQTIDFESSEELPVYLTWDDVSTYTNLWTGITPAAIHHNAHHNGLKERIQTFWNETWYFPHLRGLLHDRAAAVRAPSAITFSHEGGREIREEWWSPIDEVDGVRFDIGESQDHWLSWQDVCGSQEVADDVFRDSRGPWKNSLEKLPWDHAVAAEQLEAWKTEAKAL